MSNEGERYKIVIELHDTVRNELKILKSEITLETDNLEKAKREWENIIYFIYCHMEGENDD